MIVWGGNPGPLDTGGRYCAQSGPPPIANSYAYRQPVSHSDGNAYFNANSNSYGYSHSQSNPYRNTDNNSNAE